MGKFFQSTLILLVAAAGSAGCTTTRAATPVERPALEVPPPPPRVIVPLPPPETPLPEVVGELPTVAASGPPARPRPQRTERTEPKTDPKAEVPPPDQPPTQPTVPPAPQLRTPESSNNGLAAQVRDTINRARGILDRIPPANLNAQRQKAHQDAVLFAQQAETELKASNLVFAKELAEKAERLAKELQGR